MKKQLNCRISTATRTKLDYLTTLYGTQTEAISIAIDHLYQSHKEAIMNTNTIEKHDQISLDGKTGKQFQGTVIQDGGVKSLVQFPAPPESGCAYEQMWVENKRLTVRRRRKEKAQGDEPASVELY